MSLQIYKKNNRYAFAVDSFYSEMHSYLIPRIKPDYKFAWQAEKDGRIVKKYFSHLIKSIEKFAEEDWRHEDIGRLVCNHFWTTYDGLVESAQGAKKEDAETQEKTYKEILVVTKSILDSKKKLSEDTIDNSEYTKELDDIIGLLGELTKEYFPELFEKDKEQNSPDSNISPLTDTTASNKFGNLKLANNINNISLNENEILEFYAEMACKALEKSIPDLVYIIDVQNDYVDLVKNFEKTKIVRISIDKKTFLVNKIAPYRNIPNYNEVNFYQFFWKPIVASIGHFLLENDKIVIGQQYLPDMPNEDGKYSIEVFDLKSENIGNLEICFNKSASTWKIQSLFKVAIDTVNFSESDLIGMDGKGAMVVCIDPDMESLHKKTGMVKSVERVGEALYVDVDFGNHIVRLNTTKIQILNV